MDGQTKIVIAHLKYYVNHEKSNLKITWVLFLQSVQLLFHLLIFCHTH